MNLEEKTIFDNVRELQQKGYGTEDIIKIVDGKPLTIKRYYRLSKAGYNSPGEYHIKILTKRGFDSYTKYLEHLLEQKEKSSQYQKRKRKERAKTSPENIAFKELINLYSKETGLSQADIARKINKSREIVSRYFKGENIPSNPVFKKLSGLFDWPYSSRNKFIQSFKNKLPF